MADTVHRATFAGATIQTQATVSDDGIAMFFVDILAPTDEQCVTIGWTPDRSAFGVWINGNYIPLEETPS